MRPPDPSSRRAPMHRARTLGPLRLPPAHDPEAGPVSPDIPVRVAFTPPTWVMRAASSS